MQNAQAQAQAPAQKVAIRSARAIEGARPSSRESDQGWANCGGWEEPLTAQNPLCRRFGSLTAAQSYEQTKRRTTRKYQQHGALSALPALSYISGTAAAPFCPAGTRPLAHRIAACVASLGATGTSQINSGFGDCVSARSLFFLTTPPWFSPDLLPPWLLGLSEAPPPHSKAQQRRRKRGCDEDFFFPFPWFYVGHEAGDKGQARK
ncbi:hypothetical protein V8C35DRAFT_302250 [Trichoderma chlorosporum]